MKPKNQHLKPIFVDYIPSEVEADCIYISIKFATATHNCVCGCGNEVVTPLSPTDWKITYDGKSITLHPSIGNWSFNCKSHYWIKQNRIVWAESWSSDDINKNRASDRYRKDKFFQPSIINEDIKVIPSSPSIKNVSLWKKLKMSLFG